MTFLVKTLFYGDISIKDKFGRSFVLLRTPNNNMVLWRYGSLSYHDTVGAALSWIEEHYKEAL